jgi:outer membrane lipoprotein SlyB
MHRHVRYGTMDSGRHYDRKRIREVRLEHSEDSDAAVGAFVGAGAGAAIGAAVPGNGTVTRGGRILLLGGIGAIVGGFMGREFPMAHGRVVYRR